MVDLAFRNNQVWVLTLNMSQWAQIYDLTQVTLRSQMRVNATDILPYYSWSNVPQAGVRGTISYEPISKILTHSAPYADARRFAPGTYAWDLTLEVDDPVTGLPVFIRDLTSGSVTITSGVTLR